MSQNIDDKINELMETIKAKEDELNKHKNQALLTNGKLDGELITTFTTAEQFVNAIFKVHQKLEKFNIALEYIELGDLFKNEIEHYESLIIDLQSMYDNMIKRANIQNLRHLKSKLEDLRSEDAKRADSLSNIASLLDNIK